MFGSTTVPVASEPDCHAPADSPFAGVYDLIGNVEEWTDNCLTSTGATDICKPQGLPFGKGATAPLCNQSTYADRSEARATLGFRCCGH
jgi:formylglycine-generating enzyme required for sulfatase activity